MKLSLLPSVVLVLALGTAFAQNSPSPPKQGSSPSQESPGTGVMELGMRGIFGTVTQVADGHYSIKTGKGEIYTVYFSANTHIFKQPIRSPGENRPMRGSGIPDGPILLKPADIKTGDFIVAHGEIDSGANTVGAVVIVQLGFQDAQQLRGMAASYGKTWLVGRVTAIHGIRVSLMGVPDHTTHSFVAGKHTLFRRRQEPLKLADIHIGNMIRVDGAVRNGVFIASRVSLVGISNR